VNRWKRRAKRREGEGQKNEGKGRKKQKGKDRRKGQECKHYCPYLSSITNQVPGTEVYSVKQFFFTLIPMIKNLTIANHWHMCLGQSQKSYILSFSRVQPIHNVYAN